MEFMGTTIIMVRRDGKTAMGGDGQVTLGNTQVKSTANKVRKVNDNVLVGFAGSVADSFALVERFTEKVNMYKNNLRRAAVELAKEWRSDKVLRRLEAMMIVAGADESFLLSGSGEVIEDEIGLLAIGSGGSFAHAAARALMEETDLSAEEIVKKSLDIAAEICIYTNHHISVISL
ncbi:MAG TPA: ATP-dependent protease subunit HslV [Firmicutes bacterium]|nr:ATP-dependent protease subunit HslV [Bacillota bacterium]